MASRIVATFSGREIARLGSSWPMLQAMITPSLNVLAGCNVFWVTTEDGAMVMAPFLAETGAVHASDCALNNGPAMAARPCDCGADAERISIGERRYTLWHPPGRS